MGVGGGGRGEGVLDTLLGEAGLTWANARSRNARSSVALSDCTSVKYDATAATTVAICSTRLSGAILYRKGLRLKL